MPPRPRNAASALPDNLPPALRVGAAVAWRLLIIAAAVYVVFLVTEKLIDLVLPVGIALLLAALLSPAVSRLVRAGVPRAFATAIVLVLGLAIVGGMLTFVITQFADGLPELRTQMSEALDQINNWLSTGPLHLTDTQLQSMLDNAKEGIQGNQGEVAGHVLDTALTLGKLVGSLVLMLFTLIFFLYDGDKIWRFLTRLAPREHRDRVDVAGRRGFAALVSYIRASVAVAIIDAVSVGIGLTIVGVPLAVPLSALVFLGAFVPILGAFVTGGVAILVALVAKGVLAAVIVLCILIAVMQIEGHVLQPLLLGRAVQIHPLAVVLTIAVGLTVAGIPGALLAVPFLAVLNASIRSLLAPSDETVDPEEIDVNADESADPAPTPTSTL
jgi:predicted PurR-regulated permease PerM